MCAIFQKQCLAQAAGLETVLLSADHNTVECQEQEQLFNNVHLAYRSMDFMQYKLDVPNSILAHFLKTAPAGGACKEAVLSP
jgi:hypothetical protein